MVKEGYSSDDNVKTDQKANLTENIQFKTNTIKEQIAQLYGFMEVITNYFGISIEVIDDEKCEMPEGFLPTHYQRLQDIHVDLVTIINQLEEVQKEIR